MERKSETTRNRTRVNNLTDILITFMNEACNLHKFREITRKIQAT